MDPAHASTLLQRYTATRCGASFRELVEGHAGLVHSTALRITRDDGLAEDVMQTVFAGLAAKPDAVRDGRTLAAWLHRAASGRAVDAVRTESRRRLREHHATQMNATTNSAHSESDSLWDAAAPVIDNALGRLGETDRQLLLLRFWQRQDMRRIGLAFGLSDAAAQKRIGRALQKLRAILERRGITGTAAALSVALMASASAAPPAAAVARISAAALALSHLAPSAAAGTVFTHAIAMTAKTKIILTAAAACVAIGTPVYLQQREIRSLREENAALRAAAPPRRTVLAAQAAIGKDEDKTSIGTPANIEDAGTQPAGESGKRMVSGTPAKETSGLAAKLQPVPDISVDPNAAPGGPGLEKSTQQTTGSDGMSRAPRIGGKIKWDHSQATGAPDTPEAGDQPTAWAPTRQSGEQWLALGYEKPVEFKEINIHETHCPGAISKVAALMPDGSEKVLWHGTAAQPNAGEDSLETSLPVPAGTTTSQIKLFLDTNRVRSWPEIDAVELVGTNNSRQWASTSRASSSYSQIYFEERAAGKGRRPGRD